MGKFREQSAHRQQQKFAKKSLGQNFLNDPILRDQIIDLAGDIKEQNILEIGPGWGFLTEEILRRQANLVAIELDPRNIEILNKKLGKNPRLLLINNSILDEDLDKTFEQKKYSIIANIPYNITAPILRKIFSETVNRPEQAILMVQKEVAEKISRTKAGQTKIVKHRSILSIAVEIFAESENCFEVKREMFTPAPKVDSAILRLKTREIPLVPKELEKDFFTVVNAGFAERRKKLQNSLGKFFGVDVNRLLGEVDGNLRAENLEIADWLKITENFRKIKNCF